MTEKKTKTHLLPKIEHYQLTLMLRLGFVLKQAIQVIAKLSVTSFSCVVH